MRTRERILTIRLMEKLRVNPVYAKVLGIEVKEIQTDDDARSGC